MKRKGLLNKLVVLSTVLCLSLGTAPAHAAALPVTTETTEQNNTEVKNGWVKEKAGYCYYKKGVLQKNKWLKFGKKKYYVGADGVRKTGWYSIKNKSYYFDSKGVYKKSKAMDAKLLANLDKIIKGQKINEKTSDKVALKKLANELKNKKYGYGRAMGFHVATAKKGWDAKFSNEFLAKKGGSCFHYAAINGYLAKRATGLPVRICLGQAKAFNANKWQEHGWVEVKIGKTWYTYDANANKYSKIRKGKWLCQKHSAMEGKVYKTQKTFNVEL